MDEGDQLDVSEKIKNELANEFVRGLVGMVLPFMKIV